jgi:hypothetical protein
MVRKWVHQLRHAVDNFNKQVDEDEERQRMKRRDAEIRAQREREEAKSFARDRNQVEGWMLSMQGAVNKGRPLAERSFKAMFLAGVAASSSQPPIGTQLSIFGSGTQRSSSSSSRQLLPPGATQRPSTQTVPQAQPALPPLVLDYPPWSEDEISWFLDELDRPRITSDHLAVCAEALSRPLKEVEKEMERLGRLGRHRHHPQAAPRQAKQAPPAVVSHYPPWSEDEVGWFLDQLNKPGGRSDDLVEYAEALDRDLPEVEAEKERLRGLGLYRSPGRASVLLG